MVKLDIGVELAMALDVDVWLERVRLDGGAELDLDERLDTDAGLSRAPMENLAKANEKISTGILNPISSQYF